VHRTGQAKPMSRPQTYLTSSVRVYLTPTIENSVHTHTQLRQGTILVKYYIQVLNWNTNFDQPLSVVSAPKPCFHWLCRFHRHWGL